MMKVHQIIFQIFNFSELKHKRLDLFWKSFFRVILDKVSAGDIIISNLPSSDHSLSKTSCGITPSCCSPS